MTKKIKKTNKFNLTGNVTKVYKDPDNDGYLRIEGYANTGDKDRQNTIIPPSAWVQGVENYVKNPVVLFQHKHDTPIGKTEKIKIDKKGLFVECAISNVKDDVQDLIKQKILKSFSVGFKISDWDGLYYDEEQDVVVINSVDLLEVSVVSVPANQESLFDVKKSFDNPEDYKEYVKNLATTKIKEETDEEFSWSVKEKAEMTDKAKKEVEETPAEEVADNSVGEAATEETQSEEDVSAKEEAKDDVSPKAEVEAEKEEVSEEETSEPEVSEEKSDEPEVTIEHDLDEKPMKAEEVPVEINLNTLSDGDLVQYNEKMYQVRVVNNAQSPIYKFLAIDNSGGSNDNVITDEKVDEKLDNSSENISLEATEETTDKELQDESKETTIMDNDKEMTKDVSENTESTENASNESEATVPASAKSSVGEPKVAELVKEAGEAHVKASDTADIKGEDSSDAKEAKAEAEELRRELAKYKEKVNSLSNKMSYQDKANYMDSDQFKKDAETAVFVANAFGKHITDTEFFKNNLAEKAVTDVDTLLTTFSTTVYHEMRQKLVIADLFNEIKVSSKEMSIPYADEDTADGVAMFENGTYAGAHDTTRVPTSKQHKIKDVRFTPHKYMAETHIAKDETEDTIIPLMDFLKEATLNRLARSIDKTVLRGDGSLSGFNASDNDRDIVTGGGYPSVMTGVTELCRNAAGSRSLTVNAAQGNLVTPMDIALCRQNMGKYGVKLGSDLVFLTTIDGYNELVTYPDFRTVDKMGPGATYHTGTVGQIYGINVIMTEFLDSVVAGDTDTNQVMGTLIYKPGFKIGMMRDLQIENEYQPRTQVTNVYMSTRFDFKPLTTNQNDVLDSDRYRYASIVLNSTNNPAQEDVPHAQPSI